MKNSIEKLREVIFGISTIPTALPEGCKEVNSKYESCKRKTDSCATKGISEANDTEWMPDHRGFTPFTWKFKDCDGSICSEAYGKKIDTGTKLPDGGFNRGRGSAVSPNVMFEPAEPGTGDRSKDWNYLIKKEKEKRRCDVKKEQLNMQYAIAIAREQELFEKGCAPYIKPKQKSTAEEDPRKKRYDDAVKRINMDFAKKMVALEKTADCTPGD